MNLIYLYISCIATAYHLNTYIDPYNLQPPKTGLNLRDWTDARSKTVERWDNWHEPQVAKPPIHHSCRPTLRSQKDRCAKWRWSWR